MNKRDIVDNLNIDAERLTIKLGKCLEGDGIENIGTYRNLVSALECTTKLSRDLTKDLIKEKEILDFHEEWQIRFENLYKKNDKKYVFLTTKDMRSIGKTTFLKRMASEQNGIYLGCDECIYYQGNFKANYVVKGLESFQGVKRPIFIDEGMVKSQENLEILSSMANYFCFRTIS